ncbi:DUF4105 domain-containing protein [bacterium]|nr:DUF4105 domain-containing protein [bacterium]
MHWLQQLKRWKNLVFALCFFIPVIIYSAIQPSNHRDWSEDQTILSQAVFEGDQVKISNIRNVTYQSVSDYAVSHYDKTVHLNNIESAWYVCEPFSSWRGLAHTFISFEFSGNDYIAISVEIRKEKGESFSPIKGMLKQFEIMYVVGDEKDLIKLRTQYRRDEVFLYPLTLEKKTLRQLFVLMLKKANALHEHPEFYHTFTNTCATTIVGHINEIIPGRIPFHFNILFPGYSDDLFYQLGLVDTQLPFSEYRDFHKINSRADAYADDPAFSIFIRKFNE